MDGWAEESGRREHLDRSGSFEGILSHPPDPPLMEISPKHAHSTLDFQPVILGKSEPK